MQYFDSIFNNSGALSLFILGSVLFSLLSYLILTGSDNYAYLVVILFFGLFLGLAPAIQVANNAFPLTAPNPQEPFTLLGYFAILLGFIAFNVGYFIEPRTRSKRIIDLKVDPIISDKVDPKEWVMLHTFLLLIGLAYILAIGFSNFLSNVSAMDTRLVAVFSTRQTTIVAKSLVTIPLAFTTAYFFFLQQNSKAKVAMRFLFCTSIVTLFFLVNPLSSSRVWVGFIWGGVLFSFAKSRNSNLFKKLHSVFLLLFLYVFNSADYFRNSSGRIFSPFSVEAQIKGDFDAYSQLLNSITYVQEKGFLLGTQLLSLPLFWIPRTIWEGKPQDSANLIATYSSNRLQNLSLPYLGEGYLAFGLFGTVLFLLLLGVYVRNIDSIIRVKEDSKVTTILTPYFIVPYLIMLLRGSLHQAISILIVITVSGWVVNRILKI